MTASVELIHALSALEKLSPEWWKLWRRVPNATIFQSPAWIVPWWQIFAPGELRSIAVRIQGQRVGLAPLYLEDGALGLRLLPIGIGLSDYCDLLLDDVCSAEAGEGIMQGLAEIRDWRACEFPELLPEACALHVPAPPGTSEELCDGNFAPVLPIAAGVNTLQDAIPGAQSRKVCQAVAALKRYPRADITAAGLADMQSNLSDLVRLHSTCWSLRGEPGVFADSRVAKFHSLALPELVAQNLARVYRLNIGDVAAAVYYGFHDHRRAYAYLHGFNPDFSELRPGTLVIAHAIEEAISEGAREFHFLRGAEAYKFDWGAESRINQVRVLTRRAAADG